MESALFKKQKPEIRRRIILGGLAENTSIVDVKEESFTVNMSKIQLQDATVSSTSSAKDAEKPVARSRRPTTLPGPPRLYCPICEDTFSEIKASKRTLMLIRCSHILCSTCLKMLKKESKTIDPMAGFDHSNHKLKNVRKRQWRKRTRKRWCQETPKNPS